MDATTDYATFSTGATDSVAPPEIEEFNTKPISIAIGALGMLGNGFVVFVVAMRPSMRRTNMHFLVLNQSVLDCLASIFLIFTRIYGTQDYTGLHSPAHRAFCRTVVSQYIFWATATSSTYNLVAVSIERLIAVTYPIWYKNHYGKKQLMVCVVLVWFIGLTSELTSIISSDLSDGNCLTFYFFASPRAQQVAGICSISIQFFIPITIHTICYGKMAWVFLVKNRVKPQTGNSGTVNVSDEQARKNQQRVRNILKTFGLITLCFFGCWVLNESMWLGINLGLLDFSFVQTPFFYFSVIAVFSNCCINPLIYALKYREFQVSVMRIFGVKQIHGDSTAM